MFSDIYGPGQTTVRIFVGTKYTGRQTPTDQNVYVYDCVFQSCSSSSTGGALFCGSNVYKLLVKQTSFVSCKTSNSCGGAIHFDSQTNGECVLSKNCAYDCSSTLSGSWSAGHFAFIYIKNDVTKKNRINDSSITHTSTTSINSFETVRLYYGIILCPSVNFTNNKSNSIPVLIFYPTTGAGSPTSETCSMSYSSIINNTAIGGLGCLYLTNSGSSQRIDKCNIITNNQNSSEYGTIYANANLLIKDSCILGNNENNKVFYANSSNKMTISNCTIDDDVFTNGRYYGNVTIIKTITNTFINALSHISTHHCDSSFDSYGTLTAKPNVPSKKSHCLMSCNDDIPLRNIQFIFILIFLPFDPQTTPILTLIDKLIYQRFFT
jgi:hypothetical protein